jgi:hypothetical protein
MCTEIIDCDWSLTTQSTILNYFKCSRFSEFDSKYEYNRTCENNGSFQTILLTSVITSCFMKTGYKQNICTIIQNKHRSIIRA